MSEDGLDCRAVEILAVGVGTVLSVSVLQSVGETGRKNYERWVTERMGYERRPVFSEADRPCIFNPTADSTYLSLVLRPHTSSRPSIAAPVPDQIGVLMQEEEMTFTVVGHFVSSGCRWTGQEVAMGGWRESVIVQDRQLGNLKLSRSETRPQTTGLSAH